MKFHITIKNNETGETLFDQDVDGVFATTAGGGTIGGMQHLSCNAIELAGMYCKTTEMLKNIDKNYPVVAELANVISLAREKEEK